MSTCVAIAVITFRRPALLRGLLRSLQAQELPADSDYAIRIVVVDNDAEGSAAQVLAEFGAGTPYPIESVVEPEPGIPFAREKSVELCWNDDALIFVDDDEVAPPGWLKTLLTAWESSGADVVTGPVKGNLPPGAPPWNHYSDVHDSTGKHVTGEELRKAYTNNTLVSRRVYHAVTPGFHPAFRYTGSSDLHFFLRVYRAGFRIVWCEEAYIAEEVPVGRTTLRWLVRRAFRSGSGDTISRLLIRPGAVSYVLVLAYASARVISAIGFALTGLLLGRKTHLLKAVRRFFSGVGSLAGIVGINHDEYRERHGAEHAADRPADNSPHKSPDGSLNGQRNGQVNGQANGSADRAGDGRGAVPGDLAGGAGPGAAPVADQGRSSLADHPDARLP